MFIKEILRKFHVLTLRCFATFRCSFPLSNERVLIIAPHPDDEVIGCGGLIAKLIGEGNPPHVLVMTGGERSIRDCCDLSVQDIKGARRGLTRKALGVLGLSDENIHELNFPDGGISSDSPEVDKLKSFIDELNPSVVFVPHWGEGWPDHVRTAEIVKSIVSFSTDVWEYCVWMWYYNVWRGLDWKNAAVLQMTPQEHDFKLKAMDAYIKPLAPCGRPWSGVLPKLFVKANKWNKELYFRSSK